MTKVKSKLKKVPRKDKPKMECPLCNEEQELIYYDKVWVCHDCGGVFAAEKDHKKKGCVQK